MTGRFSVEGTDWQVLRVGSRRYPCARFRKIDVWIPQPGTKIREALVPMENQWAAVLHWGTCNYGSNRDRRGDDFDEEPTAVEIHVGTSFADDDCVLFLPYMEAAETIEVLDAVSRWPAGVIGDLAGTHET